MSTDSTPGTDVAYLHSSLQERKEYASALAAAGELVPSGFRDKNGAANPAKLLLAFETGVSLGLHPLAALQGIHVIEGKPTLSAQLMSAIVRSHGHRLRVAAKGTIEGNDYTVIATLIRKDDPDAPFTSVWTIDRARRAELFGKGTWRKYPENLLSARAISEVCRLGAADALAGLVYTPEELGATVNESGDVIDGEIVEDEQPVRQDSRRDREPKGARGVTNETRVPAASSRDATPASASRPGPSRPVTSPGTGRATPTPEPSAEQAATVAEFVDAITETDSVNALRVLHDDADKAGLLALAAANGIRLNDLFHARKAYLQRRDAEPDTEDVPLDIEGEVV